jgi:dipeptidyl aminopeptidase/acylaminoacyl peptidase
MELMYSGRWSDLSADFKTYGMPVLIGDPEKDAEQLKATSPLAQASRIKQPLLMAYGWADRRVPIQHGQTMRRAISNAEVDWVQYNDEGHIWTRLKTNVDFWTRVEKFLARNIGTEQK